MLLDDLNERLGRVLLEVKARGGLNTQRNYVLPSSSESEASEDEYVTSDHAAQNTFLEHYLASYHEAGGAEWWPYCFFSNRRFATRVVWEVAFIRGKGVVFNISEKINDESVSTHAVFDEYSGDTGDVETKDGWEDPDDGGASGRRGVADAPGLYGGKPSSRSMGRYRTEKKTERKFTPDLKLERHSDERSRLFINLYIVLYHWAKYDFLNPASDGLVVSGPPVTDTTDSDNGLLLHPRVFSLVECLKQWVGRFHADLAGQKLQYGESIAKQWKSETGNTFAPGSVEHCMDCELEEIAKHMFSVKGPVFAALTNGESKKLQDENISKRYAALNQRVLAMLRHAIEDVFGTGSRIGTLSARHSLVTSIRGGKWGAQTDTGGELSRSYEPITVFNVAVGDTIHVDGLNRDLQVRGAPLEKALFPMFVGGDYQAKKYAYPRARMFVMEGPVVLCYDGEKELQVVPGLSAIRKKVASD